MILREIPAMYKDVYELLSDPDADNEQIEIALKNIKDALHEKADAYAIIISQFTAESDYISAEIKRLQERKRSKDNRIKYLKDNLQTAMLEMDQKKFETPLYKFSIAKNPPRLVLDEDINIPEQYQLFEVKADTKAIKDALKAGETIEGARLEQSESIRIK